MIPARRGAFRTGNASQVTGVQNGLFPPDDSPLPRGWTQESKDFIRSYFDQYQQKKTEDDKIKFSAARAGSAQVPGRDLWRNWVTGCWQDWKIQAMVTAVLAEENIHPVTLLCVSGTDKWPNGAAYIPLAIDTVGKRIWGDDCLDDLSRVRSSLRPGLQAIIQRTWGNIYNQVQRSKKRLMKLEEDAATAFDSEFLSFFLGIRSSCFMNVNHLFVGLDKDQLTKAKIRAVIMKFARWKAAAEIHLNKENLNKIEEKELELERLMEGLRARLPTDNVKAKAKQQSMYNVFTSNARPNKPPRTERRTTQVSGI